MPISSTLLDAATTTLAGYAGENAFGSNDQIYGGIS